MILITWIIVILVITGLVINTQLSNEFSAFYYNKLKWKTPVSRAEYAFIDNILCEKTDYYPSLNSDGRAKFIHRLYHFKSLKRFYGKNGFQITEEVKVLVCSGAIQLTFGLKNFNLTNIKGFVIYPTAFYNPLIGKKLKGGTPPKGLMQLSWAHLEHGFKISDDRYNLCLHEMAHALKLSLHHANKFDERFASYHDNWEAIGSKEFTKMKQGVPSFLRKYGGVNMHEFFSVCIEHFFEVPETFQKMLPDIYNHLCILLNQDPVNKRGNYRINPNFDRRNGIKALIPVPKKIRKSYHYHSWHWSFNLWAFTFIPSILILFSASSYVLFSYPGLGMAYLIAGVGGVLVFYLPLKRNKILPINFLPLVGFAGVAPLIIATILSLNFLIRIDSRTETYKIKNYQAERGGIYQLNLAGNTHSENLYIGNFTTEELYHNRDTFPLKVKIVFETGLMGLDIVTEKSGTD